MAGAALVVFQGEVVADAEDPAAQVSAVFAFAEMAEEGEEDLLHDFVAIGGGDIEGEQVAEKRAAQFVVERDHIFFKARRRAG